MAMQVTLQPMTAARFAAFGDLLECSGAPDKIINQGLCGRFHDRAAMEFTDGRAGLSLFRAEPRSLPLRLDLVERHPLGSQAFIPMSMDPFLVVVAEGSDDEPGPIHAFETEPGQAINFHKGTWHGVLTPLYAPGLFAVIDRIGDGDNLQEHWFDDPPIISRAT